MIRKVLLPIVAVALLGLAVFHVVSSSQEEPEVGPPVEPPKAPYTRTVAGAGIIEAQTENIAVGSPLPGVISEVAVKVGSQVEVGDPLFRLDDRQLKADVQVQEAEVAATVSQLSRLEALPRPEEVPVAEARLNEAQAAVKERKDQLDRAQRLFRRQAINEEELIRREQAFRVTREQVSRAEAELTLLKAGSWEPEKAVARANIARATAQLEQTKTQLERLTVRALVAGEVLQVKVRPGEFVGTPPDRPLILLGNIRRLHVRVDIDEHDIPRFEKNGQAVAMIRGHADLKYPLEFVRVEPYVVPKQSLTGDNTERVDTRVLQVIYSLNPGDKPLYVGQQVDVFIEVGREPQRAVQARP